LSFVDFVRVCVCVCVMYDDDQVNESMNTLKLCDFGSAIKLTDVVEITPVLVSRFYRPPEISLLSFIYHVSRSFINSLVLVFVLSCSFCFCIVLGLPYNEMVDVWSVGCILYELYTGKILFSGQDNNEMLRMHMEAKGAFSKKILKKSQFKNEHFDSEGNFEQVKVDSVSGLVTTTFLLLLLFYLLK